ncbi:IST1 homolog isoform X2 [Patiria miniata]|uniref:IST1 homolog n=1 Tax=Patiria miniata TaxID=46514 RepID=A0A914AUJ7_PATMI|nr:IST1 homolog isoform X2 [Patiria miniata]
MFSSGFKTTKLSTSARLAIHRLKLLERKKTEEAQKARKEIADYLCIGKDERARIRVEHIIREDYLVEAMEIVELYLDLLLARMGLITSSKVLDPSIQEAVSTIIWVTPRMSADIAELKSVSQQLVCKYGKEFGESARKGECEFVNEKVKLRMSAQAPPKSLVENYLVEIARSHGVTYEPDPCILSPPEVEGLLMDLGDETLSGSKKGGGGGGGGGGMSVQLPPQQPSYPPPAQAYPPPGQAYPPPGQAYPPPGQAYPLAAQGYPPPATNPAYPPQTQPQSMNQGTNDSQPPSYSNFAPSRGPPARPKAPPVGPATPGAPPYSENDPMYPPNPQAGKPPAASQPEPSMPVLPQVPTNSFPPLDNSVGGKPGGGEDVDFDDLTRRFEELKKKK